MINQLAALAAHNLEKVGDNIYAKRDAMFSQDCTALVLHTFGANF